MFVQAYLSAGGDCSGRRLGPGESVSDESKLVVTVHQRGRQMRWSGDDSYLRSGAVSSRNDQRSD